ncbi:minor tail protein [Gordonia phage Schmidt]|uniref:Minor tail protein n=1 Tax=Gordonia phage Schmidt TaxID=2301697 RepID=A0A385E086_9CAUD|nr:minor tail protein [Gordonia phage Schmidt]AXQ65146.1 minor tail protein [Gordonia phage Schmidt]
MADYDKDGATFDDLSLGLTAQFIDYEDYPTSGVLLVEVRNKRGLLQLPRGRQGIQGPPGEAARPFEHIELITDESELPDDPTEGQKSTGYVTEGEGEFWAWSERSGEFVNVGQFRGPQGDRGPSVQLVPGNIGTTAPGGEPSHGFTEVAPGVFEYHVSLPRGQQGPEGRRGPAGPSAAIQNAEDYNQEAGTPQVGSVLRYGALGRWEPAPYYAETGPYYPDAAAWTEYNQLVGTTAPQRTMVTVNVPAQPFPWRPRAFSGCHMAGPVDGNMAAEIRLGSDSGAIVARGVCYGGGDQWLQATPDYDGKPDQAVVAAGEDVTLFLVLRRLAGVLPWKHRKGLASLNVWCVPVTDDLVTGGGPAGVEFDGGVL